MSALDDVMKCVLENNKTHYSITDPLVSEKAVWELAVLRAENERLKRLVKILKEEGSVICVRDVDGENPLVISYNGGKE